MAEMLVTALVLCGGRGSRMGGVDKPLEQFQGRPLVAHVLGRIAPQVQGRVIISANRHAEVYAGFGYPVLADELSDFQGPLAGLLAGLTYVGQMRQQMQQQMRQQPGSQPEADRTGSDEGKGLGQSQGQSQCHSQSQDEEEGADHWVLCVSGDSPWLPLDLLQRLAAALPGDGAAALDSAMAWGREAPGTPLRSQPLASLIHTRHQPALAEALARGERRVEAWLRTLPLAEVAFDRPQDGHAFANINDRSQLERPYPVP